jgi:ankyrin repeat protein
MAPFRLTFCNLWLTATLFLACTGVAAESTLMRCPALDLPVGFDPANPVETRHALKGAPRLFYLLGQSHRAELMRALKRGANPNVCVFGMSLLSISIAGGNFDEVQLLLDHGAEPNQPLSDDGKVPPLSTALDMGRFRIANLLLDRGADPRYCIGGGRSCEDGGTAALHDLAIAVVAPSSPLASERLELAKRLIDLGADVNAQVTIPGTTPLMLATITNNKPLVALLLERGANPELTNRKGETPIALAKKKGYADIADLLSRASSTSTTKP